MSRHIHRLIFGVQFALLGFICTIPVSTSLMSIFWIASLVLILATPFYRQQLTAIYASPFAKFSISMFIIALLSCFWGDAVVSAKLSMLGKYVRFLFFPLLIAGFTVKKFRYQALHFFIGAMFITAILSVLKWSGVLIWRSPDPGEVFYNHIMTALMMSYASYVTVWLGYKLKNKLHQGLYALLFLLFTFQIFFISPGRTGYVVYSLLIALFIFQTFPLKKALLTIFIGGALFGYVVYQSPVVKEGIHHLTSDIFFYKNHELDTSLGYRIQFHDFAKQLFSQHWLIGNGIAGFEHAFDTQNPVPTWPGHHLSEPHSQYWLILTEFGLLGFSVFCLFFNCPSKRNIPS